jgi:hypothetical protein
MDGQIQSTLDSINKWAAFVFVSEFDIRASNLLLIVGHVVYNRSKAPNPA